MPHLFVIILNWNLPEMTIDCLKSISQSVVKSFDLTILVVDNGSTDNSVKDIQKAIERLDKRDLNWSYTIIENDDNLGFVGGNNIGIEYALQNFADYILLLNNDTLVDKHLFSTLVKKMENDMKVGAMSPKIYFAKGFEYHKDRYKDQELGRIIWYAGGQMDWSNIYGSNYGVDEVDHGQFDKEKKTDFATGCCMIVRAEAINEVGLFDERYYLYLEDSDLSMRLQKASWNVVYYPKGFLWHKVSQSSGIGSNLNDYFITRNRLLFGMKYAHFRTKIALIRESVTFLLSGREWQKVGVKDFYLRKFGKGSWNSKKKST